MNFDGCVYLRVCKHAAGAAPERDSHSTHGFGLSGSHLGMQFILLLFLRAPSPPAHTSPRILLNTIPIPLGCRGWEVQPGLPSSGGHYWSREHLLHIQTMNCGSLQQIKAFKSFFF